jgi:hypothetical protein
MMPLCDIDQPLIKSIFSKNFPTNFWMRPFDVVVKGLADVV